MASRLSRDERVWIEAGIAAGDSMEVIAGRLGRHRSTVWREVRAGGGPDRYRAGDADARAAGAACRPRVRVLARCPQLAALVAEGLARRWSPHAIVAWLKTVSPDQRCCAETIYQAAYLNDDTSGLAAGSWKLLPDAKRRRQPRSRCERVRRNQLGDIRPIAERPDSADDRSEPGHWEGDLLMGAANRSAVVTLVERTCRFCHLADLPEGHTAPSVSAALIDTYDEVPEHLRLSLTWDQGREMTDWQTTEAGTGLTVYFADPHAPWQRPTNEHTNRLLRRWLPKGTNIGIPQTDLDTIAHNLNTMPRRSLGWRSPADLYTQLCRDHQ